MSTVVQPQTSAPAAPPALGKKDFVSSQEVRWCPGCGDYSILSQIQKVLPDLGVPKENFVFISGIGCSSRLPYYVDTFGVHGIHGRAPTLATGLKCARPELSVWIGTGDGDGLSIGGNHMLHTLRRNVDLNIILFNNRIYGLTKGQTSPTSEKGKRTRSTPFGSIELPINPVSFALACEATFVARSMASEPQHLAMVLKRAGMHRGVSFIEVWQNCNIFNDGAFTTITERAVKQDRVVYLEHDKPLIFGKDRNHGIHQEGTHLSVLENATDTDQSLLVHNELEPDPTLSYLLSRMDYPDFPIAMGVFRAVEKPAYDELLNEQVDFAVTDRGKGDLHDLIYGRETWQVE